MSSQVFTVTLTFCEPLVGAAPLNHELYTDFVAAKANGGNVDDELESLEEALQKGATGFHRLAGRPALYDYAVKGFFKDACSMLRRVPGTRSNKLTAYKKIIDGLLFVKPRLIPLMFDGELAVLERPLRAQTAQGERISLARSEMAPAGATLTFTVTALGPDVNADLLREWLDYGAMRGMGQWRNGGYGAFAYSLAAA